MAGGSRSRMRMALARRSCDAGMRRRLLSLIVWPYSLLMCSALYLSTAISTGTCPLPRRALERALHTCHAPNTQTLWQMLFSSLACMALHMTRLSICAITDITLCSSCSLKHRFAGMTDWAFLHPPAKMSGRSPRTVPLALQVQPMLHPRAQSALVTQCPQKPPAHRCHCSLLSSAQILHSSMTAEY